MSKTFGLLFYLKKSKVDTQGKAPIYLRITVNGKRSEISIKRRTDINKWCNKANKVKGNTEEVRELNAYIDILTSKIYNHQRELIHDDKEVTAETIKSKKRTFLEGGIDLPLKGAFRNRTFVVDFLPLPLLSLDISHTF